MPNKDSNINMKITIAMITFVFEHCFELTDLLAEEISAARELTKGPERELKFKSNHGGVARSLLDTTHKGRLLTPEEGCGHSKVQNKRIIGGSPAKNCKLMHFLKNSFIKSNININF